MTQGVEMPILFMTFCNDSFPKSLSPLQASRDAIELNVLLIKGGMLPTGDNTVTIILEGRILSIFWASHLFSIHKKKIKRKEMD